MKHLTTKLPYRYFNKNNFKYISTLGDYKNDLELMKTITPKRLGKIAVDVSKCANTDIKIWDTFIQSSEISIPSFDYKDVLRTLKGLDTFYQYLDYQIRNNDLPFLEKFLERVFECSESYNWTELSEVSEIVSKFVVSNDSLIDPSKLFAKIAVLLKIRLAEASSSDVVRIMVSFSKVGITDKSLIYTLVDFSLSNRQTTPDDLRTLSTSCVILDYCPKRLLDKLCESYQNMQGLTANCLAILSFIFSKASYTNDKVIKIFEKNLENDITMPDLDHFCINLHKIGVRVPEKLVNSIDLDRVEDNVLTELLDLLSQFPHKQESILKKCKNIQRNDYLNTKILEYITKGTFTKLTHELFNLVVSDIPECFNEIKYLELLTKLPVNWLLETYEKIGNINLKRENIQLLTLIVTSLISFVKFCRGNGGTHSPEDGCLLKNLENRITEIEKECDTTVLDALNSLLATKKDDDGPYILIKEIEKLLNKEIEVTFLMGKFKVFLVKDTKTALITVGPEEFVNLEEEHSGCMWIPPSKVPRIELLSRMYLISRSNYDLIPISYHEWSKLGDSESKRNYLCELLRQHTTGCNIHTNS